MVDDTNAIIYSVFRQKSIDDTRNNKQKQIVQIEKYPQNTICSWAITHQPLRSDPHKNFCGILAAFMEQEVWKINNRPTTKHASLHSPTIYKYNIEVHGFHPLGARRRSTLELYGGGRDLDCTKVRLCICLNRSAVQVANRKSNTTHLWYLQKCIRRMTVQKFGTTSTTNVHAFKW